MSLTSWKAPKVSRLPTLLKPKSTTGEMVEREAIPALFYFSSSGPAGYGEYFVKCLDRQKDFPARRGILIVCLLYTSRGEEDASVIITLLEEITGAEVK